MIVIATYSKSVFALKLDLLLDWAVVFEALLYSGLIAIRLKAHYIITKNLLLVASILYGLSRVAQTVILAYFFAGSYSRIARANEQQVYWPGVVLGSALTVLQTYTALIYYRLWARCSPVIHKSEDSADSNAGMMVAHVPETDAANTIIGMVLGVPTGVSDTSGDQLQPSQSVSLQARLSRLSLGHPVSKDLEEMGPLRSGMDSLDSIAESGVELQNVAHRSSFNKRNHSFLRYGLGVSHQTF